MPKTREDTTKHTLHLFTGDYEKLRGFYSTVGAAKIIRTLVHRHIEQIEESAGEAPTLTVSPDLEI